MKTEAIQNLIKSGPSLVLGRDSGQTGEWERSIGKKQRKGFRCAWLEGQPAAGYLEAGSLAWLVWVTYWGFSGLESLTESCPSRAEAPGACCCQGWGPGGVLFSYMVWPLPFWIFNLSVLYLKQTVLICQEYFFLLGTIKNIFSVKYGWEASLHKSLVFLYILQVEAQTSYIPDYFLRMFVEQPLKLEMISFLWNRPHICL